MTKKEFLPVVYGFEKFRAYVLGTKDVVHTENATLLYLMAKMEAMLRFICWVLLLRDRKGCENQVVEHLSSLE